MPATLSLEVDLSGWTRNVDRVDAACTVMQGTVVQIGPRDIANYDKAVKSFDRGDTTYPVSAEAKARGGNFIARGLKAVSAGASVDSIVGVLDSVGKSIARDVKAEILAGRVAGPARSPAWIKRKGQNINMVGLTGRFVRSLISKIVK